jgi:sigma-70-like protein
VPRGTYRCAAITPSRRAQRSAVGSASGGSGWLVIHGPLVLSDKERRALAWRHLDGLTYKQIGDRLGGVTLERARQIENRARYRLLTIAEGRAPTLVTLRAKMAVPLKDEHISALRAAIREAGPDARG